MTKVSKKVAVSVHADKRGQVAPDAPILRMIGEIRAAWGDGNSSKPGWSDEDLSAYLEKHVNQPERKLRTMRPKTVSGALAKACFAKWYAGECGSDDWDLNPAYVGLRVAIADLTALA